MTGPARPIDHCVLPTADLDIARERLTELGFTVARDGLHPFGTRNCCVYLADGTFLEPLAIANRARTQTAASEGNVFVTRDGAFRSRLGDEGFSALVFGTSDADEDHRDFVRAGVSAGRMLSFSRPFVDAAGHEDLASFKLAFAADPRAPDAFFFACERVNAPAVDRSALQRHQNAATRVKAIVLAAGEPAEFAAFLEQVVRALAVVEGDGLALAAANGEVRVRRAAAMASQPNPGLVLTGIVFGVKDLAPLRDILGKNGVEHDLGDAHISVAATAGQGAEFIFEEL